MIPLTCCRLNLYAALIPWRVSDISFFSMALINLEIPDTLIDLDVLTLLERSVILFQ